MRGPYPHLPKNGPNDARSAPAEALLGQRPLCSPKFARRLGRRTADEGRRWGVATVRSKGNQKETNHVPMCCWLDFLQGGGQGAASTFQNYGPFLVSP